MTLGATKRRSFGSAPQSPLQGVPSRDPANHRRAAWFWLSGTETVAGEPCTGPPLKPWDLARSREALQGIPRGGILLE